MNKLLLFLIMACSASAACCFSFYNSCYNNFESLKPSGKAFVRENFLEIDNNTARDITLLDSLSINNYHDFKYFMRFANLHNKEGKGYKVTDSRGKRLTMTDTKCGIVFFYTPNNYWTIKVSCSNSDLYNESIDVRSMSIALYHVINGKERLKENVTLDKGVDLNDGLNYLGVKVEGTTIKVLAGKETLNEVITHNPNKKDLEMMKGVDTFKVGIFAGPGAFLSLERTVLTQSNTPENPAVTLQTQWTKEALDRHFAHSKNPFEGYWTYLDRDMEDKWLKLGGRYTIALVENDKGYDVIYVDGAQVKKSLWFIGMKKAEMVKTIFTDNFTGKWYDATFEPIDEDVYITFESGVILNFKFPVYKSQVRFSKVLE